MATDIHAVNKNLVSFYDFSNKRVLHGGEGGGQLSSKIGYFGRQWRFRCSLDG